jgi:hypothetical protein
MVNPYTIEEIKSLIDEVPKILKYIKHSRLVKYIASQHESMLQKYSSAGDKKRSTREIQIIKGLVIVMNSILYMTHPMHNHHPEVAKLLTILEV